MTLMVDGHPFRCLIDTGSEVTLLKNSFKYHLQSSRWHKPTRFLAGVTGTTLAVTGEVDAVFSVSASKSFVHRVCVVEGLSFPGELLVGTDLLRRFEYSLVGDPSPQSGHLKLDEVILPITYTNTSSLRIHIISKRVISENCEQPCVSSDSADANRSTIYVKKKMTVPSRSGRFIPVVSPSVKREEYLVIEPISTIVAIPSAVLSPKKDLLIWVVNLQSRPVTLCKGPSLACHRR